MKIKVGISGFGRIGRLAFRRMIEDEDFEIVAINNGSTAENLAYLLKYDTAHRIFKGHDISWEDNNIIFDGKKIPCFKQYDPTLIDWKKYGAELILECSGKFKGIKTAGPHITNGGAKIVLISAPADKDTPTVVYGVNDDIITKDMTILSGASCTTNCLAPVMKVLEDKFGVEGGFMTTVHAYTNDQSTLDGDKEKDFRRGRTAATNIIPTTSGAASALHLVLPKLKGRLHGGALRVPVIDGSLVDLSLTLKKKVTVEDINNAMKEASETYLKDILGYNDELIVSNDILGSTYGGVYDATQTLVFDNPEGKQFVKVVAWYDNEYSYTCQYIRLAKAIAKKQGLI